MSSSASRIERIVVQGFKAFEDRATLELTPLTLVLGRNGSGKSLLTRLPAFIDAALQGGAHGLPMRTQGMSLGNTFVDLCPGRLPGSIVDIEIHFSGACPGVLSVALGPERRPSLAQRIHRWRWAPHEGATLSLEWTRDGDHYAGDGAPRRVVFRGLLPDLPDLVLPHTPSPSHLGPYRVAVPPVEPTPDRITRTLDVDGRGAGAVLASHAAAGHREVLDHVVAFYAEHLGFELSLEDLSNEAAGRFFGLAVRARGRSAWINLAQVGTGTASVLPFVVQHALVQVATPDAPDLLVCEEPEAHLHPSAQAELADLALMTAAGGRARVLIETHSETLLLRVRRRVAEGTLPPEHVQLLWVNDEGPRTRVNRLRLERDGWVDDWPVGLFAEARFEAQALARAMTEGVGR